MDGMFGRDTAVDIYLGAMSEEPVFHAPSHQPKGMLANEVDVFNLVSKYFPSRAVPAIMGNLAVESYQPKTKDRFNYQSKEVNGGGYGLAQLTGGKKKDYFKWIKKNDLMDSPESQVMYMRNLIYSDDPAHEIGRGNQKKIQGMFADPTMTTYELTEKFMNLFENPKAGKEHLDRRIGWAYKYDQLLPFDEF